MAGLNPSISETLDTTDQPAFATSDLRIVAWNSAAERALGHSARHVIGRPCYQVLEATDEAGNSFCGAPCPFLATLADGQPVRATKLWIRGADRQRIAVTVTALVVPGANPKETTLVHLLSPTGEQAEDPRSADAEPVTSSKPGAEYSLTDRERQVLLLLAQGKSTRSMADDLFISPATVRCHIQSITGKLDVHTRLQAVIMAHREQLI